LSLAYAELAQHDGFEDLPRPLDANAGLYTFWEIAAAPAYFALDREMVQLRCAGIEADKDGYNPSGVQSVKVHSYDADKTAIVIVRTEEDEGAYSAESRFCRYQASGELVELDIARRPWEDAAICVLADGTIVTSGVRAIWDKDDPTKLIRFFTEYYSGPTLDTQVYLGQSPDGHKDSRLAVIDGQIVIWTRPQQRSQEGKIHYTILNSIDELRGPSNEIGEHVAQAVYDRCEPVGAGIFADGTWGGPNGAVDVGGGWALVQCHVSHRLWEAAISQKPEGSTTSLSEVLRYDGFMLLHHPATGAAYIFGPHVSERQFPVGGAKWPKVRQVAFPGGLHDVRVFSDGNIEGRSTVGVRDKDMYAISWRTVHSLAKILLGQ